MESTLIVNGARKRYAEGQKLVPRKFPNFPDINLPYLTYPWMDADFPANTNYGYLGYVIGHEIGHAFDHFHRKLDESGRQQQYWFTETNSSNTEYELREKCLRDQYSAYKEPGYDFFVSFKS